MSEYLPFDKFTRRQVDLRRQGSYNDFGTNLGTLYLAKQHWLQSGVRKISQEWAYGLSNADTAAGLTYASLFNGNAVSRYHKLTTLRCFRADFEGLTQDESSSSSNFRARFVAAYTDTLSSTGDCSYPTTEAIRTTSKGIYQQASILFVKRNIF